MKRFGGKFQKVFLLAIFGVLLGTAFLFGVGIKTIKAQNVTPPSSAACTATPGISNDYQCSGATAGVLIGGSSKDQTKLANLNVCTAQCLTGGGVTLRYGTPGSYQYYCYGATRGFTCNVGGTITNVSQTAAPVPTCATDITGIGCWLSSIFNLLLNVGVSLLGSVLAIIAIILENIFGGVTTLYLWSINSSMLIPVTPSASGVVEIVTKGWNISRDIVNLLFVVILAFIGLATILRRQDFELQKMLPTFILIALLVNFSGVLVGFIVDIGNIITNFFLTHASSGFWSLNFPEKVFVLDPNAPASNIANISGSLARIVFYLIASLIYSVVSLLFFVRIFILWMLSILAPLAFFAYVLPATRKFWTQWWTQLIQWSLIGIPISFFMWLARLSLESNTSSLGVNASGVPIPGPGILASFLGPITALFLLYFGITLSMQLAPASAQGIIKWGAKSGIGASGAVAGWAGRKLRDVLPEKTRNALEQGALAPNPSWGQNQKTAGGYLLRRAADIAGWTRRTPVGALKSVIIETGQKDFEEAKAEALKQTDANGALQLLRQNMRGKYGRAGIWDAIRQKGWFNDVNDPQKQGKGNTPKQNEIIDDYRFALQTGNDDLAKGFRNAYGAQEWKDVNGNPKYLYQKNPITNRDEKIPVIDYNENGIPIGPKMKDGEQVFKTRTMQDDFKEITDETTSTALEIKDRTGIKAGTYTDGYGKQVVVAQDRPSGLTESDVKKGYSSFLEKIFAEAKGDDIKSLQKGFWDNDEAMEAIHKFWGGPQVSQAATQFGREFTSRLETTKKSADWYFGITENKDDKGNITRTPQNIAMARFLTSNAAQGLGISPIQGLENKTTVDAKATIANILRDQPALTDQYMILSAIVGKQETLRKEKSQGAPQEALGKLQNEIDTELRTIKSDIAMKLGSAKNPDKFESDWNRIEELLMKPRTKKKR